MNNSKTEDMVTNALMVLMLTGIAPFLACIILIGIAGWLLL